MHGHPKLKYYIFSIVVIYHKTHLTSNTYFINPKSLFIFAF